MHKLYLILMVMMLTATDAAAADEELLRQIYTQIPQESLTKISTEEVAVALLKGLNRVDKKLQVGNDNDKISLYYQGKLLTSRYKPQERDNAAQWAALSAELTDLAVDNSKLAAKHDFELVDLMLQAAIDKMGKGAKFYMSTEEMRGKKFKHQVHFAARTEGEYLYIKILDFNAYTYDNTVEAINNHKNAGGLILDLRGNPGGRFDEAVRIADLFLDNEIIASTKGRKAEDAVYYNAEQGDVWQGKQIVILVDAETASAAEVLTAALQEQGRAKVIGTRTFGKASVQKLITLNSGSIVAITKAYYYTPSGFLIEGKGIIPDVCTFEMPEAKNIDNLLALPKNENCRGQARKNEGLDLDAAKRLLEKSKQPQTV